MSDPVPLPSDAQSLDTGLACLVMLAQFHGMSVSPEQLSHEHRRPGHAFGESEILLAARQLKLKARIIRAESQRLPQTPLPAIAVTKEGQFFILARAEGEKFLIHRPDQQRPEIIGLEYLLEIWSNKLILVASHGSGVTDLRRFDFTWFIPSIIKYRKLLSEVLVVSFVLQIFALIMPLFFQVVMDKVLVHRGLSTLDVVAAGLLGVMIFESVLSGLRSYVFAHTASRIDVELSAKLFRHLVSLPLAYYQARRVGDSVARVKELENIRSFLTGNSITLLMDVMFTVVFLAVMLYYSKWLTLIVLLSLPCYIVLSMIITPVLRSRVNDSAAKNAENQAFLVETINGIDTLKSMAVEPQITKRWDDYLAAYVSAGFRTQTLSTVATEMTGLIGKLVTVATLWLGARLVIDGDLSIGQIIAFNMLAGRVAQPIMRLSQLWTNFQQTSVSVQRLGEILNTKSEVSSANRTTLPPILGRIEFDQVHFRYRPDGSEVLRGISLTISPGEVIGIVGRSGSGKSTLTRLLQRLYVPERGRVLVDGMDLVLADVTSLRRQIGVVLQDNILFARTIRENIALIDPGASLDAVIRAATMAGAHDFILELPEGYDTVVGEHGASLSGGQRQRIAIARALIGNPRILIFDEATSALDYESEKTIQQNMQLICKGRTVVIIAHRLSAVRDANRIAVVDRGQIVECGSHQELLSHQAGHYSRLHRMQQG